MNWVEAVGYIASALVVLSLTRSRVLHLRVLSLVGALMFGIYGVLIASVPIALTNAAITFVNLWHLGRIVTGREDFSLLEVPIDSPYLRRFLEFHADEIGAAQPDYTGIRDGDTVVMVLRDMVPAAVVVGRPRDHHFRVYLDFAIPRYRDFKMGAWFYGRRSDFFDRLDCHSILATAHTPIQRRYLVRSGFSRRPDGKWERPVG